MPVQPGTYFITVCLHNRECLFGDIVAVMMRLNEMGRMVAEEWPTPEQSDLKSPWMNGDDRAPAPFLPGAQYEPTLWMHGHTPDNRLQPIFEHPIEKPQ